MSSDAIRANYPSIQQDARSHLSISSFHPWPELLTEEEAIRYLRLDTISISNPSATLRRYREQNLLRGTQVSKRILYRRTELDRFLERITELNPR